MPCLRLFAALFILWPFVAVGIDTACGNMTEKQIMWESGAPIPSRENLSFPNGAVDIVVHRAGSDPYNFLHDAAIVEHKGTLYAAWYNCPEGEIEQESLIRGRRSTDLGHTWSDVEVIASDREKRGILYVPVAFLSHDGTLYAFVSRMIGHDLLTGWEAFILDDTAAPSVNPEATAWTSLAVYNDLFLPNSAPVRASDGSFLMAGRMAEGPGEKPLIPAVARNRGDLRKQPWEIVPLLPSKELPDGRQLAFPETAAIVEECAVTAFVRSGSNESLLFSSEDCGVTWSGPHRHNLPMGASKIYAGLLTKGQRYAIFNTPTKNYRDLLTIAVSRPGERTFSRMWKIREGYSNALRMGPEWSYPCAIESKGSLCVVYTSEKHHCVMTTIPLKSLSAD